jgi:acyl-CoA thioester hydrolase
MLVAMDGRFRFRFRVRYQECDAQKIVFNARWGDYIDVAATEMARAALGGPEAADWKLVRQLIQWKASARFDEVLEARLTTTVLGTTSFTVSTEFFRIDGGADGPQLVTAETVYVMTDPETSRKRPITDEERRLLAPGAIVGLVDCSG